VDCTVSMSVTAVPVLGKYGGCHWTKNRPVKLKLRRTGLPARGLPAFDIPNGLWPLAGRGVGGGGGIYALQSLAGADRPGVALSSGANKRPAPLVAGVPSSCWANGRAPRPARARPAKNCRRSSHFRLRESPKAAGGAQTESAPLHLPLKQYPKEATTSEEGAASAGSVLHRH
jgi:hypothetical protein